MLCMLILYISGGTSCLKSTPNDRLFEKLFVAVLIYSQSGPRSWVIILTKGLKWPIMYKWFIIFVKPRQMKTVGRKMGKYEEIAYDSGKPSMLLFWLLWDFWENSEEENHHQHYEVFEVYGKFSIRVFHIWYERQEASVVNNAKT